MIEKTLKQTRAYDTLPFAALPAVLETTTSWIPDSQHTKAYLRRLQGIVVLLGNDTAVKFRNNGI